MGKAEDVLSKSRNAIVNLDIEGSRKHVKIRLMLACLHKNLLRLDWLRVWRTSIKNKREMSIYWLSLSAEEAMKEGIKFSNHA